MLYHKRIHDGTSSEREAKHAQENLAGKEALEAHVSREHLLARVMMTDQRSVYTVKYDTPGNPLVSMNWRSDLLVQKKLYPEITAGTVIVDGTDAGAILRENTVQ